MNIVDTQPTININIRELKRLLGLPQDYEVEGRIEQLVEWSKSWYAEHGRPWIYARQVENVKLEGDEVQIDGVPLHSKVLHERFKRAKANSAVLVALGAGPEVDEEAARHWTEGRPEEYFFLETYSSAVVEYLATAVGAQLCERADNLSMAVLPPLQPGVSAVGLKRSARFIRPCTFQWSVLNAGKPGTPFLRHAPPEKIDAGGVWTHQAC